MATLKETVYFQFFEKSKRGGISSIGSQRLAVTKQGLDALKQYSPETAAMLNQPRENCPDKILYIDATNLYDEYFSPRQHCKLM